MTTTVVHAATTVEALVRDDEAEAMDVDEPHGDSVAEEIILAAYRKDAVTVAECLKRCTPEATAEMSLSRAAAVELLGEDVYLGSHSWSTQEGFPVMYFAGANPGFRRRATHAPAPPSEGRGARHLPRFRFSRERNHLLPSHRASNRWTRPSSRPDETSRAGPSPREHHPSRPRRFFRETIPRAVAIPPRAPPARPCLAPASRKNAMACQSSRGSWNPAWSRYFATSKFFACTFSCATRPRRRGAGRPPRARARPLSPLSPLPPYR